MGDLSDNFDRDEFECKCNCGQDTIDAELIKVLEDVREYYGAPITINSGNRCKEYNKSIGGSPNSQHLIGKAADIVVKDVSPDEVFKYLFDKYLDKYGEGCYTHFTHIDVRKRAVRWDG